MSNATICAVFGSALMLSGFLLIGQGIHAYSDWQSLLLFVGGACAIRTGWPPFASRLGLKEKAE